MNKLLNTEVGQKIVSIILGLGLASMFRRICNNNTCLVIKGPKIVEMDKYYKIDKKCYKYNPYPINCPNKENFV
jgi:hypothetical protein|tara:strand:- start:296 stop:517 length:222 start_codon:yes stop_codon:yes gene_type:complete